jgi:peptide/nickel transport system substrate-binding protein
MNTAEPRGRNGLTRRDLLARGGSVLGGMTAAQLLAACGGDDAAAPQGTGAAATDTTAGGAVKRFDEVRVGVSATPLGLDPHKTTSSELSAFHHLFEPLINRMPDRTLVPALADGELERVDDTTWRARLRAGRTFTDGSPITVEDVKYSFDRVLDPEFASPYRDYLSFFESVEVVDETTVEIKTTVATDLVPDRSSIVRVIPQKIASAKSAEEFSRNPEVGSGSMIPAPLAQNEIRMTAYEDYEGVFPINADVARYIFIPEAQTRIAQLESGQLHITSEIPPALYDAVRNSENLELGITPLDSASTIATAMFNCGKEPFSDQRVRQAFMYAIDRDQLVEVANLGQATVADSPLPASNPFHVTPDVVYTHDPERAKALLSEAGYPDGLTFELHCSDIAGTKEYAPLLEQQLRTAGMTAKLRVTGIDGYFSEIFAGNYSCFVFPHQFEVFSYDVDMLIRGWWGGFFNEKAAFWTTDGAKRIPQLLDEALGETDDARKTELYGEAQQIIVEEAGSAPLIFQPTVHAWRKDVLDYQTPFTFIVALYNIHPA